LKPDGIDSKILKALMDDGRASFRRIAERTSLTTPTVTARYARMKKAGLIEKFVPILSADSIDRGVVAMLTLRVNSHSGEKVAKDLARLREVEGVYMTTGQNIFLRVTLNDARGLQTFLREKVLTRPGVEVSTSEIVTSIVKEEPPSLLPSMLTMNLNCDYCHGEVTSSRPYTVAAGSSHYYFCCRTCRRAYLEKYGTRLARIRQDSRERALHS